YSPPGAVTPTAPPLQRASLRRSCSTSVYASPTRPCLQYQIKRCSGPCVGRIGAADYEALVGEAREFLAGRSREVQERLAREMQTKSEALEFEAAARPPGRPPPPRPPPSHPAVNNPGMDAGDPIAPPPTAGPTRTRRCV